MGKALEESDAMVVLLSPEAARSESVQREIDYALVSLNYKNKVNSSPGAPHQGLSVDSAQNADYPGKKERQGNRQGNRQSA